MGDISTMKFPLKLYKIISDCDSGSIKWNRNGTTIIISLSSFQSEYLSNSGYFKTNHLTSFIRSLNIYGFQIVKLDRRSCPYGYTEYENSYFRKGCPHLLKFMKRKTSKSNKRRKNNSLTEKFKDYSQHKKIKMESGGKYFVESLYSSKVIANIKEEKKDFMEKPWWELQRNQSPGGLNDLNMVKAEIPTLNFNFPKFESCGKIEVKESVEDDKQSEDDEMQTGDKIIAFNKTFYSGKPDGDCIEINKNEDSLKNPWREFGVESLTLQSNDLKLDIYDNKEEDTKNDNCNEKVKESDVSSSFNSNVSNLTDTSSIDSNLKHDVMFPFPTGNSFEQNAVNNDKIFASMDLAQEPKLDWSQEQIIAEYQEILPSNFNQMAFIDDSVMPSITALSPQDNNFTLESFLEWTKCISSPTS